MKIAIFIVALLAICQGIMIPHYGKLVDSYAKTFRLDLNVEPYHRWDHIVPTYKGILQTFIKNIINRLPLKEEFYQDFAKFAVAQPKYDDFVREIQGIANVAGVDWKRLLLSNFMYEISTDIPAIKACSSIVAKNKDGNILHGRNLDFWPWGLFSKGTAIVEVYRGNQYVATFDQIIGSVFVLSGQKKGSFSVTVDTRKNAYGFKRTLDNLMVKHYVPSAFLTRILLETDGITYEEAVEGLKNTNTIAPIYYIAAGTTKGCVIEKQDVGYHGFYEIGPDTKEWFLVQTNYDKGQDPNTDQRRAPAELRLATIGQNKINSSNLFDIMKTYPTLNIASIYTVIFSPSLGLNNLTLWYGNIDDFNQNQAQSFLRPARYSTEQDSDLYINDPWARSQVFQDFLTFDEIIYRQNYFLQQSQQVAY